MSLVETSMVKEAWTPFNHTIMNLHVVNNVIQITKLLSPSCIFLINFMVILIWQFSNCGMYACCFAIPTKILSVWVIIDQSMPLYSPIKFSHRQIITVSTLQINPTCLQIILAFILSLTK